MIDLAESVQLFAGLWLLVLVILCAAEIPNTPKLWVTYLWEAVIITVPLTASVALVYLALT